MLYGNCAKDMQVYSRQDQLRSAGRAAAVPLRLSICRGKNGSTASVLHTRAAREGLGNDAC